jgi:hypothetical protein
MALTFRFLGFSFRKGGTVSIPAIRSVATVAMRWMYDGGAPNLSIAPRGRATRWRRCVGPRSLVAIKAPCGRAAWWPSPISVHLFVQNLYLGFTIATDECSSAVRPHHRPKNFSAPTFFAPHFLPVRPRIDALAGCCGADECVMFH